MAMDPPPPPPDTTAPPPAGKPAKKLSKLQHHNARLAAQLADANKRIARLRYERQLLLDKLYEQEKRHAVEDLGDVESMVSSESEGEYRECEWWRDVDLGAVLARNPVASLPTVSLPVAAVPGKRQTKQTRGKKREPVNATAMTSEDDLVDDNTDHDGLQSDLFEYEAANGSQAINITSSPPTKKRRSNKASAADAVLKTIPVEYDADGKPQMPLNVGVVTVEALGEVVFDRPAYHNRRYILPVGFHSTRSYLSTVDPNNQCVYHSRILDGGATPLFQVTPEDSPGTVFSAPTSTGAWSAVVRAANQLRSREYTNSASGPDYYGLSNATVAMLIEDLANSDRCINYQRKRFERGAAHVKPATSRKMSEHGIIDNVIVDGSDQQVSGVPSELDIVEPEPILEP